MSSATAKLAVIVIMFFIKLSIPELQQIARRRSNEASRRTTPYSLKYASNSPALSCKESRHNRRKNILHVLGEVTEMSGDELGTSPRTGTFTRGFPSGDENLSPQI
jgi:hypothetical protein